MGGGGGQLEEWVMIHKIKALYDEGRGLPIRGIARELGVSRNTVRSYRREQTQTNSKPLVCFSTHATGYSRRL